MTTIAEAVVQLRAETAAFQRNMAAVRSTVGHVESSMNAMGSAVKRTVAGLLTFEAARRAITFVARETMEAEQSMARLEGVLKATGNVTGHTTRELEQLADTLERTTLFKDDELRSAIAVLATFRSVSGDAFTETIRLATDMSAVFSQDLQSSVVQLGKAMEDPITGLTALRRIGVSFSQVQKDLIASLVEENKLFEAQQEILKGVAIQVKGAADAMGSKGLTGTVNSLGDAWRNLAKEVGAATFADPDTVREMKALSGLLNTIREQFVLIRGDSRAAIEIRLKRNQAQISALGGADDKPGQARPMTAREEESAQGDLQRAYQRLLDERENLMVQLRPFLEAEEKAKKITEDAATAAAKLADAERARAKVLADAPELEKKQLAALKALADETARIMENRWDQFVAGLQAAEDAEESAAKKIAAAQKQAAEQMERTAEALQRAQDEFAKDEAAREWEAGWGHALKRIQDDVKEGFEELFTGQIKSARDFAALLLRIISQTMAQLAAGKLTSGLAGLFSGSMPAPPQLSDFIRMPSLVLPGGPPAISAPNVIVNLSMSAVSMDPRTAADLLTEQAGTIGGIVLQQMRESSGFKQAMNGSM